jgi:hypothetical protein
VPGSRRIAESIEEVDRFAAELDRWFLAAGELDALGQYRTQLSTLGDVLRPPLRQNRERLCAIPTDQEPGTVYDECRRADRATVFLRRLWRWFADRFDQRRRDDVRDVLRAADQVVWSCWQQTWQLTGAGRPGPAPLPYLDPQLAASTTPRVDVPPDLAAVRDRRLAEQVRIMPVPVIALPERVAWRPWWLVLLAHEVGHHVQFELSPGAGESVRDVVRAAAGKAGADDDEAGRWERWSGEIFADAYAAAMVGPAISWAVGELELRGGDGMVRPPTPGYPPPIVRLALLTGDRPVVPEVAGLLTRAPEIAAALHTVPVGTATLAAMTERAAQWRQATAVWRRQLTASTEPRAATTIEAARLAVAGGVAAWQESPGRIDADLLRRRLLAIVPDCGPPGVRAAAPPAAGVERAARSVTDVILGAELP